MSCSGNCCDGAKSCSGPCCSGSSSSSRSSSGGCPCAKARSHAHSGHLSCGVAPPQPLVFVAAYNTFDNLAHAPSGHPAKHSIYTYRLCPRTGTMTLLSVVKHDGPDTMNLAFMRYHPIHNVLYACTESIKENGQVVAFAVSPTTGTLHKISSQSAGGTSTCYLTIDKALQNMLVVNYWDSTLSILPLSQTGAISGPMRKLIKSERTTKKKVDAKAEKREDHLRHRQSESHAHAVVLDPSHGRIAYVPDLGDDCIKQYIFDPATGSLTPAGTILAGFEPEELKAHPYGPRYLEFHPRIHSAYLVNELDSSVSVYEYNEGAVLSLEEAYASGASSSVGSQTPTLGLIQNIRTIPPGFCKEMNTCGRICVDPTGRFVLVSNRGHNSIAVFRVVEEGTHRGMLNLIGFHHTRGRTPRHFQFDSSGRFLIVANQDTDKIAIFHFDQETGELQYTGNTYDVPSPNFVCVHTPYELQCGEKARL